MNAPSGFLPRILLAAFLLLPVGAKAQAPSVEFFESFVQALLERDNRQLMEYAAPAERYFAGGELLPEIEVFVYGRAGVRVHNPDFRPIAEIAASGAHGIKIVSQDDGRVTFYWIPQQHLSEAGESEFFQREWMRKYFACEFAPVDGTWRLAFNFCFAETGGPHHEPYG